MAPNIKQNIASENEPRSNLNLIAVMGISSTTTAAKSLIHM